MQDMETIYQDLTSVDIEGQKRLWDERGKGYYGEYLLFTQLYQRVQGQSKILMNLKIPTENGRTTEIDLLMIHESGIYVFEAKHYKGTIYGRYEDSTWTQYFRTQKNSHFPSPIKQNEYHIAALKHMFPGIPASSFIVFTNEDTEVKVTNWEGTGVVVCKIDQIPWYIEQINRSLDKQLTVEQIESIFTSLSAYSPMSHEKVTEEGVEIPFTEYTNKIKSDFSDSVAMERDAQHRMFKHRLHTVVVVALIICAIVILGALYTWNLSQEKVKEAQTAQRAAENKLEDFSKKFREVAPMNGGTVELKDDFLKVYDVELRESADLKDTILFSCKLQINGEKYGLHIYRNSTVVVQFKDGSVAEYLLSAQVNIFSEKSLANFSPGWYSTSTELPEIQIYTKSKNDIAYIKLTNVGIFNQGNYGKNLLPGVEFKLYAAE